VLNCNDQKSKIPKRRAPKKDKTYGFHCQKIKIAQRQAPDAERPFLASKQTSE
jgi:hypothetical protein